MNAKKAYIIIGCIVAAVIVGCIAASSALSRGGDYSEATEPAETTAAASSAGAVSDEPRIELDCPTDMPKELDAELFVKYAYELKYIFAVDSFGEPKDISVNQLVQFAFCHLYNDSLTDNNGSESMIYRSSDAKSINDKLKQMFNVTGVNITSADLYNKSSGMFEMWEPNYGADVFANAKLKKDGERYVISIEFFENQAKLAAVGRSELTLGVDGENYYMSSMK